MKKRQKKKNAYKHYIRSIFTGYERMLEDPELEQLTFTYLNEETQLTRDSILSYQMERLVGRKTGCTKFWCSLFYGALPALFYNNFLQKMVLLKY